MDDAIKFSLALLIIFFGAVLITRIGNIGGEARAEITPIVNSSPLPSILPGSQRELVVYTYDGITSEWGLGPKIFPKFEKACGCKIRVVARGDVGVMVSQLIFEKDSPKADVVLGIDNTFREKVASEDLLDSYVPKSIGFLDQALIPSSNGVPDFRFIPFDFGYVGFVYDSDRLKVAPKGLEDLTLANYAKKIIIEDAQTSSTGKIFLYWIASEYGNATAEYLLRLKPSLLTITPGWSEAYSLFLQGEAPLVLSYTTSPAYHAVNENTTRYKAAIFPKMYRQIEYVGIARGAKERKIAEQFVEFMLSEEAQKEIPLGNYMYPARHGIALPDAFSALEKPSGAANEITDGEKWLKIWEESYSG